MGISFCLLPPAFCLLKEPERILYLAVPIDIFNTFFQERFTQAAISKYGLKIIAYKPDTEEIIAWKN